MDERFFDLKKEKQDRILNAAMKVFAANGYKYGSTEQIVKEAGISKGLLFHYFGTKQELYLFLYDYSVRVLQLEMRRDLGTEDDDLFAAWDRYMKALSGTMGQYPFLPAFLDNADRERNFVPQEDLD
jgi:AcrR family transcriptional regulator